MLRTFRSLRFGLTVGIGGGIPNLAKAIDIRLGDVVVSEPAGTFGGVVQYDKGKRLAGGDFELKGQLNRPPTALLTALAKLKANHELRDSLVPQYLTEMIQRFPRMVKRGYSYPGVDQDILYCNCCDRSVALTSQEACPAHLTREPRSDANPEFHYGVIASGNSVIKDTDERERLGEQFGALCVEMEAAGLMNNFPCLVIRGVCDYADSHKNNAWHPYAAATAAAYAKELLSVIPAHDVKKAQKAADLMKDVADNVATIQATTSDIRNTVNQQQELKELKEILAWLTPVDYAPQQTDFIGRRQKGTGEWLLHSNEFNTWLNGTEQTLFCPGHPGSGKTMITSIIIHHLHEKVRNESTVSVAYVYCNFRRQYEQSPKDLLANFLKQLVYQQGYCHEAVKHLYEKHRKGGTGPQLEEILDTLSVVMTSNSRTFIIIDALDECGLSYGQRKNFLTEVFKLQRQTGMNLFATSRIIPEIIEEFKGSIRKDIRAHDEDVQAYLEGRIPELRSFVSRNADLQEEIKTSITKAVDGMFLLAKLHLDSLIGKKSLKSMKTALQQLPSGSSAFDTAYKEAMERIEGQIPDSREMAKQALSWITCAKRPLATSELRFALAVEIGIPKFDEENLPELEDIVSVCAGLVIVDEESDIIRLVHYTTQEFFERNLNSLSTNAQAQIAEICIACLSFDGVESRRSSRDMEVEEKIKFDCSL